MKSKDANGLGIFFAIYFLLIFCISCSKGPEDARRELGQMNIKYSKESFFERIKDGDVLAVKLFLLSGMDPNLQDASIYDEDTKTYYDGDTLLLAAAHSNQTEIMKILLANGANPNLKGGRYSWSPLQVSATMGNFDAIKMLIQKGANINEKDKADWTVLVHAITGLGNKTTDIFDYLLIKGADINYKTKDGTTLLMKAARFGRNDIANLLIKHSLDINAKDNYGKTPLMYAALFGRTDTVNLLLDKNANINERDRRGQTALILASWKGYVETVKALLARGADTNIRTEKYNLTALDIAKNNGHNEIVNILSNGERR